MAPGGIEPPHAGSKPAALSTELRGRSRSVCPTSRRYPVRRRGGGSSVGRAPGCGPGGRGFESRSPPFCRSRLWASAGQGILRAAMRSPWGLHSVPGPVGRRRRGRLSLAGALEEPDAGRGASAAGSRAAGGAAGDLRPGAGGAAAGRDDLATVATTVAGNARADRPSARRRRRRVRPLLRVRRVPAASPGAAPTPPAQPAEPSPAATPKPTPAADAGSEADSDSYADADADPDPDADPGSHAEPAAGADRGDAAGRDARCQPDTEPDSNPNHAAAARLARAGRDADPTCSTRPGPHAARVGARRHEPRAHRPARAGEEQGEKEKGRRSHHQHDEHDEHDD